MTTLTQDQQELILKLIYGDIDEVPLSVLGPASMSFDEWHELDEEQRTRLAAAATVAEYFAGKQ